MRYFEDLEIGAETHFGSYEVTREEVLDFARKYDPQPFHLSDEDAAKTHFGRRRASLAETGLSGRHAPRERQDHRKDAVTLKAGNRLIPDRDNGDQPGRHPGHAIQIDRADPSTPRTVKTVGGIRSIRGDANAAPESLQSILRPRFVERVEARSLLASARSVRRSARSARRSARAQRCWVHAARCSAVNSRLRTVGDELIVR